MRQAAHEVSGRAVVQMLSSMILFSSSVEGEQSTGTLCIGVHLMIENRMAESSRRRDPPKTGPMFYDIVTSQC